MPAGTWGAQTGTTSNGEVFDENVHGVLGIIDLAGAKPQSAQAWSLIGPAVDATNEKDPNAVHLVHRDLGRVEDGCTVEFPPHSLSAVEIRVGP